MLSLFGETRPKVVVALDAHEPSIRGFRIDGVLCVPKARTEWFAIGAQLLPRRIFLPPNAQAPRGYIVVPGSGSTREAILVPRHELTIDGEDFVVVVPAWPDAAA